jgi:carbon monoxide dehydrogenase subunit G
MTKIEASVVIDRPAEAVWKFISDWSNAPKWMPGALEVRQTSAGPLGIGTTLQSRWSTMSPGASLVTECEPGRKITLLTTLPQMIRGTRESLMLENIEGKTRLNTAWELKFNGFYRLVGPFLVGRIRKSNEAMVSNVKRILESEARAEA